ncbi:MAG: hypothetical protein RL757_3229 [Bacteroidota bacterium]|jgi:hypothetical protein
MQHKTTQNKFYSVKLIIANFRYYPTPQYKPIKK